MTKSTYTLHRIFAVSFAAVLAFCLANYVFELGYFGGDRGAKGVVILGCGLMLIYLMFFAPTREQGY